MRFNEQGCFKSISAGIHPLIIIRLLFLVSFFTVSVGQAQNRFSESHYVIHGAVPDNQVKAILQDKNEFYWILSSGGWLTRWNGRTFLPMKQVSHTRYLNAAYDMSGDIFFQRVDSGYDYVDDNSRVMPLPEERRRYLPLNFTGAITYLDKSWKEIADRNAPRLAERFKTGFLQWPVFQYFISPQERYQLYNWASSDTAYHYLSGTITAVPLHKDQDKKITVLNSCLVVIHSVDSFLVYKQGKLVSSGREPSLRHITGSIIIAHQLTRNAFFINIRGVIYKLRLLHYRPEVTRYLEKVFDQSTPGSFYIEEAKELLFQLSPKGGFTVFGAKPIVVRKSTENDVAAVCYTVFKKGTRLLANSDFQPYVRPGEFSYNDVAPVVETGDGDIFYPSESRLFRCDTHLRILQKWTVAAGLTRCAERAGPLCFFSKNGLQVLDTRNNQIAGFDPDPAFKPEEQLIYFVKGNETMFYIATTRGLFSLDLSTRKRYLITDFFAGKDVRSIKIDEGTGILFVTVKNEGIYCLDKTGQRIHQLPVGEELSLLSAHYLLKDKSGDYWIPTNNGLFLMYANDLKAYLKGTRQTIPFLEFGADYGIENPEFNGGFTNSGLVEGDSIFMTSMSGIVAFAPEVLKTKIKSVSGSRILLNGIWVDDSLVNSSNKVQLPANFKRCVFRFDFPVVNTPGVQLEYRLDGISDNTWTPVNQEFVVLLRSLSAGSYTLTVRVVNRPEVKPLVFSVNVKQYWYKTKTAYLIYILAAAGITWLLFNRRIHRIRNQSLMEIDKNRRQLFAIISHDLRNPLNAYQGLADMISYLLKTRDYERLEKVAAQIDSTGAKLDLLMNNLLNWNLLQQGKLVAKKEKLNLTAILEEHTAIYADLALLKGNKLTLSGKGPVQIHADRDLLLLIIRNLLDNAIKNSVRNKEIRVSLFHEKEKAVLQIRNAISNAGREKLEKVKRLFEENQTWEPGEKGMGMGLKMVQMAAKKMNTALKVDIQEQEVVFSVHFLTERTG